MTSEWTFAVTFESDTQQPETIRGEVTGSLSAAVGRAVRVARQQKPTRSYYESVVVRVEKRRDARAETRGSIKVVDGDVDPPTLKEQTP